MFGLKCTGWTSLKVLLMSKICSSEIWWGDSLFSSDVTIGLVFQLCTTWVPAWDHSAYGGEGKIQQSEAPVLWGSHPVLFLGITGLGHWPKTWLLCRWGRESLVGASHDQYSREVLSDRIPGTSQVESLLYKEEGFSVSWLENGSQNLVTDKTHLNMKSLDFFCWAFSQFLRCCFDNYYF